MNRFVKRIISISMGFVSVASVVPFTGSASPKTEKELAADIQKSVMNIYRCKSKIKKIKKIKSQIKENEKFIKKLEDEKELIKDTIKSKSKKCDKLRCEINNCPYYNCRECNRLNNKIKYLKSSIKELEKRLDNKESKLIFAKEKREKLDGELAVILQNKELDDLYF